MSKNKLIFLLFILLALPLEIFAAYSCSISTNNANFGNFGPLNYTSQTISVNFSVTCSNPGGVLPTNVSGTVTFSMGNSGSYSSRTMKSGINSLSYNLYKDSTASSQILGDGTGGTYTYTISGTLSLTNNNTMTFSNTLYGKIPAQPTAAIGSYTDSIIITLTYQ